MNIFLTYLKYILRLFTFIIFLFPASVFSQTTVTFCASGCTFGTAGTWTVPCGVNSITVECIGGGGAGGGDGVDNAVGSAGGGGGAFARSVIAVSSGNTFVWSVGGAGAAGTGAGGNGGNTTFGTTIVVAEGGKGGGTNGGAVGAGGLSTNSTGDIKFSGGSGALNAGTAGGGGGGTGGSASNGNNGGNPTGAAAVADGYAGGNGGADAANGNAPAAGQYGGGGGGSGDRSGGSESGGAGIGGYIKITYTVPALGSGTFTVGPSGDNFSSIGQALSCLANPITGAVVLELQSDYVSTVESFPMTLSPVNGASATNTITIRPAAGATGLSIQGTPLSNIDLITFNNADYFIFDGRPGGLGSDIELSIRNLRTAATVGSVFTFLNDASNNTLTYLNIEGEVLNADQKGLIFFSTTTATTGNDNNTISYSKIRDLSSGGTAAMPGAGVYSNGTIGKANSGIIIDNCEFIDIYNIGVEGTSGTQNILCYDGSDNWTITNNHFYQTVSFSGLIEGLNIMRFYSGGGYTITGNYIGGTARSCGGTPYTVSDVSGQFIGINFEGTTSGAANTISNNTISNINYSSVISANAGTGVTLLAGLVVIRGSSNFTVGSSGNGNTLGSTTLANSIVVTHDGTILNGLDAIFNGSTGTVSIAYNTFGGLTVTGTRTGSLSRLIRNNAGTTTVDNNIFGSTLANNILVSNNSEFYGIINTATNGITVTNNIFRNIQHNATSALFGGIYSTAGVLTATSNTLKDITGASNANYSMVYHVPSVAATANISTDTIQNITLTGTTTANFNGIYISTSSAVTCNSNTIGSTTNNNISLAGNSLSSGISKLGTGTLTCNTNTIQEFNLTNAGTTAQFYGIINGDGIINATGNTIKNIDIASTLSSYTIVGFKNVTGSNPTFTKNIIQNLNATAAGASTEVLGIHGSSAGGILTKNLISGLTNTTTTGGSISGIFSIVGAWDMFNNVILLDNSTNTNGLNIRGIWLSNSSTMRIHHNTVKIFGSASTNTNNTACLYSDNTGTKTINNNIFQNLRTGTGNHYAVQLGSVASLTINNNYDEVADDQTKVCYYASDNTFGVWQTNSGATSDLNGTTTLNASGYATTDFIGANAGANILGTVADDKDDAARDATPWMGAYESGYVCTPLTYTVNSTNDVNDGTCNGAHCSLREAIIAANTNCGHDTIVFNLGLGGPYTISTLSALPDITDNDGVTIDGWENGTNDGTPNTIPVFSTTGASPMNPVYKVILTGGAGVTTGLVLASDNNIIKGMVFKDFGDGSPSLGDMAISISGDSNQIHGCYIGMDEAGIVKAGTRTFTGISISGSGNQIGNGTAAGANLISGMNNADTEPAGILLAGAGAVGNSVKGNMIGLQKDGSTIVASALQSMGIYINSSATNNIIGGTLAGEGNVISGNKNQYNYGSGISLSDATTTGNIILGNIIGPRADGITYVTSHDQVNGIYIYNAPDNVIGGNSVGARNIISANGEVGIYIVQASSTGNIIKGNYIGLDKNGTSFITGSNQDYGIYVEGNSGGNNTIGGSGAGEGNSISGNTVTGIHLKSSAVAGNSILGNIIGPQADGITFLASNPQTSGIYIENSPNNTIGGNTALTRNIISANETNGIYITGASSTGNIIKGNYIGIDKNGTTFIAGSSQDYGVIFFNGSGNIIGGSAADEGNVISGNLTGIFCGSSAVGGNSILGNIIGPQANGTSYLASNVQGIGINISNSPNNTVGGNTALTRNIISANESEGVRVEGASATGNLVKGNFIGIDKNGTTFIASSSQDYGVFIISSAGSNIIGGSGADEGNVISGNKNAFTSGRGIYIGSTAVAGNSVLGNIIGLQANGITYLGSNEQNRGIEISDSRNNIVGGNTAGERNIISGNEGYGVYITGGSSTGNLIKGNYIGLDENGTTFITSSTQEYGILVNSAASNTIGGSGAGEGNVLSGNSTYGIGLTSVPAAGNLIKGNIIGPQSDGITNLASNAQGTGVWVFNSLNNTIGGTAALEKNIISSNLFVGIRFEGAASTGNNLKGNYIGPGSTLASIVGSGQDQGISIDNSSSNNSIGGSAAGEPNQIAFNTVEGVSLFGVATTGNLISRNPIYSNTGEPIDLNYGVNQANSGKAIPVITSATLTSVTGTSGAGNTIEVFKNTTGNCYDATTYVGTAVADGSGNWSLAVALSYCDYVLANATDGSNNTSEFCSCTIINPPILVTSTADAGAGTLRQAILDANAACGHQIINFDLGAGGPFTITLASALPDLTDNSGATIDGWENQANDGTPNTIPVFNATVTTPLNPVYKVILGNGGGVATGLVLASNNNIIKGLVMQNFGDGVPGANDIAITITGNTNQVTGCYIGVEETGTTRGTNTAIGIQITGATNIIGNGTAAGANLISGLNGALYGVNITGAGALTNSIKGNIIGLQKDGSTLVAGAVQARGVNIISSASGNTIGGSLAGEGNVISGNNDGAGTGRGIYISSSAAGGNSVIGNIIGPMADGLSNVASNAQYRGIQIEDSPNNLIGGNTAGARNIISANEDYGVYFTGATSTGNIVKGNYIGIDKNGTTFIAGSSQGIGVRFDASAGSNTIGGSGANEGNAISGNTLYGIYLNSSAVAGNSILGNTIGPQSDGVSFLASNSQSSGIQINNSPNNTIGGNTALTRNIISANESYGVYITGASSTGNAVKGNYIGIDKNGTTFITGSTQDYGVYLASTSGGSNTIGGSAAGEGNVISGNKVGAGSGYGVYTNSSAVAGNTITGNIIGAQADGITFLSSNEQTVGISISNSPNNVVGGSTALTRNIISANQNYGVWVAFSGSVGNVIKGNYIGPGSTLSNITSSSQDYGVFILADANNNTIGGIAAGESNQIAFNTVNGIYLFNTTTIENLITRNSIYSNSGKAINLNYGVNQGNSGKAVPVFTSVTLTLVSGTSGAGNVIEVFKNTTGNAFDATTYVGTTTADGAGNWSLVVALAAGDYVLANATDGSNNTSEFVMFVCTPTTYTVTNTADAGAGSLRQAIIDANANCGHDIINFNLGAGGPFTITLASALPNLTDNRGVTIDGWENAANDGSPNTIPVFSATVGTPLNPVYKIILSNGGGITTGLIIPSDSNIIKGLVLQNFGDGTPSSNDIAINITGDVNQVLGCYIGMDETGTTKGANSAIGIQITGNTNQIGNGTAAGANLISGMNGNQYGINISGATATSNTIRGNMIGLQKDGSTIVTGALQSSGVYIQSSAASNTIGGSVAGEGNVISGNKETAGNSYGIVIGSSAVAGNSVLGNIIGPQANGTSYVASNPQSNGIYLFNSRNNIIGGNTALARNIISANEFSGLYVTGATTTGNLIKGNYIGIDKNGTNIITSSTQNFGFFLGVSATGNFIGGNGLGEGNLISGNSGTGIYFFSGAVANTVIGNIIGPQADGATWVTGNTQGDGIQLGDSPSNIIGGNTAGDRNIISANEQYGIIISGAASTGNLIKGNYIGPDITGTAFITGSTQSRGVNITSSAILNVIGGSGAGEGNLISGNKESATNGYGITIGFTVAGGNSVLGNIIGPQADGATLFPSNAQYYGIYIDNSPDNIIGGNIAGARNIISGNESAGIVITRASSTGNIVKGNYIGLDITGTTFITGSTQDYGIYISSSAGGSIIGGTGAGDGNVISGNSLTATIGYGILTSSDAAAGNTYLGNIIGPQADGITNVASNTQSVGIFLLGSKNNTIGGSAAGSRNIISANLNWGVFIQDVGSTGNMVKGNYIGPGSTLASVTGSSQDYGIYIQSSAANNSIGGSLAGEPNQIAFNTTGGMYLINAATTGNLISRNPVYTNTGKPINLNYGGSQANSGKAIPVITSVSTTTVTGTSGAGNTIEVFKNTTGNCYDATTYVGTAVADGSGNWSLAVALAYCDYVLATATDGSNNTSEFTTCTVVNPPLLVNTTADAGAGSLRQAIIDANAFCGHQTINFDLGPAGPYTITLASVLPNLTDNAGVTIDGFENGTNDGSPNTIPVFNATVGTPLNPVYKVILGNGGGVTTGLVLASDNNIIKGLVMQNFGDGTPSANDIAITITGDTNQVNGCYIGMEQTGTTRGTNTAIGIQITGGNNAIGDGTVAGVNLISGMNANYGVWVTTGATPTNNTIKGNLIGLQKDGTTLVAGANQSTGILINGTATSTVIGGTAAGEGNVISGNNSTGVEILSLGIAGNTVLGNIIGPRANGVNYVSSNVQSVGISITCPNNIIGGNSAGARNIISANQSTGVAITGASSTGNIVKGNYIGIDKNGTTFIAGSTQDFGVSISSSAASNIIGGSGAGEGNVISGNMDATSTGRGILITSAAVAGNSVIGNIIGPQADGLTFITSNAQFRGVEISGSQNNTIGGNTAGARNIISANQLNGVLITGATSTGNVVKGNYIGIDKNGTGFITGSTQNYGVHITSSAASNTIGGSGAGEGNVISGNNYFGVGPGIYLNSAAVAGNTILGNIIGPQADGVTRLANNTQYKGIEISSSPNNIIGGNTAGARNIISANNNVGINILWAASTGNIIKGNYIGLAQNGTSVIASSTQINGISIDGSATGNTIGGSGAGEGNVISGSSGNSTENTGVFIKGSATANNVLGNIIGLQADGVTYLASNQQVYGVRISSSSANIIGGNVAGARNIISGNETYGVHISQATSTGNIVKGNYIGSGSSLANIAGSSQDYGVYFNESAVNNTVGGAAAGAANQILFNTVNGVYVIDPLYVPTPRTNGNLISRNPIYTTTGKAINLNYGSKEGNNGKAVPVISTVTLTDVTGTSAAGDIIEVFKNTSNGCNDAITYVGTTTADGSGNWTLAVALVAGEYVLATATDAGNNTSEFSGCESFIFTSTINPAILCQGQSIDVPFTVTGTFYSGNIFTAQLSDASGSFAAPTTIGTLTSYSGGTINATIPIATPVGANYRIRVISTIPAVTGQNNGADLSVVVSNPSTYTVTNTSDAGIGSLRQAIIDANANCGHDTINFNLGAGGPFTISLTSALPDLSDNSGVTIDGFENAANDGSPNTIPVFNATVATPLNPVYKIILGNGGGITTGLVLAQNNNIIKGLVLQNFGDGTPSDNDIAIKVTGDYNQVLGCYIGMEETGTTRGTNTALGIEISGNYNNIGNGTAAGANLISGMNGSLYGVYLIGSGTANTIKGNIIGLQKDGSTIVAGATQNSGIEIGFAANNITIGGSVAGEGNVISGNNSNGIYIDNADSPGNHTILGNIIGPQANGTSLVVGNPQTDGVSVNNSYDNIIGGNSAGARNIISANQSQGVYVYSSQGNIIKGNYIGLDKIGTSFIAGSSQDNGIYFDIFTRYNTIGGKGTGEGNVISGNSFAGFYGDDHVTDSIFGNIIGPQADGITYVAGNLQTYGLYLGWMNDYTIGGNTAGARNIISANETYGIYIEDLRSGSNPSHTIKGNYIGPGSSLANIAGSSQDFGIYITSSSNKNKIGGTGAGDANYIAFNTVDGVNLFDAGTIENLISRNLIYSNTNKGINLNYGVNQGNLGKAIPVISTLNSTTITGTSAAGDVIEVFKNRTGNCNDAKTYVGNATADGGGNWSVVSAFTAGDYMLATATTAVNNTSEFSVCVSCTPVTYTVTNTADAGAGSLRQAIINANANCGHDTIVFNLGAGGPFTIALASALPNLTDNAGATIDGWENAANDGTPNTIPVFSATAGTPLNPVYKIILGNTPGTIPTGLVLASDSNIIKGLVMQNFGDGVVSANDIAITITGGTNQVLGCFIGMEETGTTRGTNTTVGIQISGANNIIGNGTAAGVNLISGMNSSLYGINFTGAGATGNSVEGNMIGLQKDGSTKVAGATQGYGVNITSSAASNTIGGSIAGEGNVISGNTIRGIRTNSTAAAGNTVTGNIIGPMADGISYVVANAQDAGVLIEGSPNNIIGGNTVGARNIISGNESIGVDIYNPGATGNVVKGNYIGVDKNGTAFITGSNQNTGVIIEVDATSNTIGGSGAGEGNVISGNTVGININTTAVAGNTILGNIIGPQADGITLVASNIQTSGIYIENSPNNIIGGNSAGAKNIISANQSYGIYFTGASSTGNIAKGNYIGPGSSLANIASSNQDYGLYIASSTTSNTIGGSGAGEANIIAYNTANGAFLIDAATTGNLISRNPIYSNTGKPINLNYGGSQANSGKAIPAITTINATTVSGTSGAGNTVEVFKNTTANCNDASVYLGTATADGSGNWSLGSLTLVGGDYVLATATDGSNNTSEFCACQLAIPANTITTSAIAPTTLCKGGNITVAYTITGTYNAGNVFTAQLSDAAGSFATPTDIGNVTATTNTSITATIPVGTASGTGYRIRVVSSNPATTGSNNGANLLVPVDGGAGTWTWVGGISTNWFDRCNWDKKSLPDASSDVVVPGGTANEPEIAGAAGSCNTIVIDSDNGGRLLLNSPVGILNVTQ